VLDKIQDFTDLIVWRKSHQFVINIYRITKDFPNEEKYGLVSQMRRAAVSIPANIAEGFRKYSKKEKANFYNIAQGSLDELRYYLILSKDLGYLQSISEFQAAATEIKCFMH
jgi:four helix bundle protein